MRTLSIFPLLAFFVLAVLQGTNASGADASDTKVATSSSEDDNDAGSNGVITLTSRNFDSSIKDGSVWLIEFHSPWCGHCKRFAQTYSEVAEYIHKQNKDGQRKVMVAKIDGSKEKALTSRFSVKGYPSFFLLDGWDVYEFNQARSKKAMIEFATNKGKGKESVSFFMGPFGPFGQLRALMMNTGTTTLDVYDHIVENYFLSPTLVAVLMAGVGVFFGTIFVIIVGLFMLPKPKAD